SSAPSRGPGPNAAGTFLVLGAAGIWGSMQFTYLAIYNTTAGNAVILQAATPVIVVLIARFYLGERLRRVQWLGVVASVLGVLLVITRGPFAVLEPADLHSGDFITLASLGSLAVSTVYGKRVLASSWPRSYSASGSASGTSSGRSSSSPAWASPRASTRRSPPSRTTPPSHRPPAYPSADESFLISARILSGSGNSPLPYRSMNRIFPCLSTMKVARTLAFHSGQ